MDNLTNKRRQQAEVNAPALNSSQSSQQISSSGLDAAKSRSQSVPEMRLAAPPAQPFPNQPPAAKIFSKPSEPVVDKLTGTLQTEL